MAPEQGLAGLPAWLGSEGGGGSGGVSPNVDELHLWGLRTHPPPAGWTGQLGGRVAYGWCQELELAVERRWSSHPGRCPNRPGAAPRRAAGRGQ